ncbi:unnamed protein product [Scytosiphon promiscuus]
MRRRDNSDPNRNSAISRPTCVIVCFHSSLIALSTQQTPSAVLHSGAPPCGARRAVHGDRPRAGSRNRAQEARERIIIPERQGIYRQVPDVVRKVCSSLRRRACSCS